MLEIGKQWRGTAALPWVGPDPTLEMARVKGRSLFHLRVINSASKYLLHQAGKLNANDAI